ncbi:MAG: glucose-6-phosphate isomerase [Deltaproteobacteria bacterium]|nr:MAG: glucose-6-phosphate isomerase [Deltaproteobacteria bacterium]
MIVWRDKYWQERMGISLHFANMMTDAIGEVHGITDEELDGLKARGKAIDRDLRERRKAGELPFYELPYQKSEVRNILKKVKKIQDKYDNFVVLGIGGSALGAKALHLALSHPQHNLLPKGKRKDALRLFVADNIDPEGFKALLDIIDPKKTVFNVVSKSGGTAEIIAQFLVVIDLLKKRLGRKMYKNYIIATTDPKKGALREIANREGFLGFSVPEGVGGRFSVFTPVGLLPAAAAGIDIEELLAGAAYMDKQCQVDDLREKPAYIAAALQYLADVNKGKAISVIMPYADRLSGVGDWYCQLWAESLGKRYSRDNEVVNVGQTPVKAIGVTDQHSQLQLYLEGPYNKVVIFIVPKKYKKEVKIPPAYEDIEAVNYLGGHTLNALIKAEQEATELALTKNNRPNWKILLPEINPFSVGQLLYFFEVQTVYAGGLYNINPLDQPGVEEGKRITYRMMGREGF